MAIFVPDSQAEPECAPDGYTEAYRAGNSVEAHLLQGMLESRGIPARLEGEALTGGIGELPVDAVQVSLWVPLGRLARARELLEEYELQSGTEAPEWQCPACGEPNDGGFDICWQCQASRPG